MNIQHIRQLIWRLSHRGNYPRDRFLSFFVAPGTAAISCFRSLSSGVALMDNFIHSRSPAKVRTCASVISTLFACATLITTYDALAQGGVGGPIAVGTFVPPGT